MLTLPAAQDGSDRFRLLVQGVIDYAIFMIDPQGFVSTWNPGAEKLKGYKDTEIIGQHFSIFYTPEDRRAGRPESVLEEARACGRYSEEGWRMRKDGTRFFACVVMDAIYDDDGVLIGFAKITRDISDRHRIQEDLERTRQQLFQAQKLEAIGNLTGGVAHDFNNLLTVIRGNLELAERHAAGNAALKSLLATIQGAAARATDLTHHLLSFARRQPLERKVIDPAVQLRETITFLGRSLRHDILIDVDVPHNLWKVDTDPRQLELAVLNVSLNARDAMEGREGTLRVVARNQVVNSKQLGISGRFVTIAVSDNGVGIPADLLEKVIEPFFTTKEVGKANGLGLSQAYGFSRQSGGTLAIESTPDIGTTVTFYLPAVSQEGETKDGMDTKQAAPRTVLVVEDDPDVADLAAAILNDNGYEATLALNAAEALSRINGGQHFDAVFSDIVMPGKMNGIDLADELSTNHPELPVLLTTGYSEAAVSLGARRYPIITKPYRMAELLTRIEQLVEAGG